MNEIAFRGTSRDRMAEIRKADDGYSLFRWRITDETTEPMQEQHCMGWGSAFSKAVDYLNNEQISNSLFRQPLR